MLRVLHRWIGVALAVPILLVSLSGGLLLLRDPYHRWRYPELAREITAAQRAHEPDVLERLDRTFAPATVRTVKFPREGVNAFHVYLTDRSEAFVDPWSGAVVARWDRTSSVPAFVFDLHAHLLMGATGGTLSGFAALALIFLALTGTLAWYPRRRAFALARPVPRRLAPGEFLRAHAASGVWLGVPVLLFAVTGAGIVFYEPLSRVMTQAFDATAAEVPAARVAPRAVRMRPWRDILNAVEAAFPEPGPLMVSPGTSSNAALTFRKSLPGEWHPNGRSYVLVDPYTAAVVQTIDARRQGPGTRAMHALYPLHAARGAGAVLIPVATLAAAGLAWLTLGGAALHVRRRLTCSTGLRGTCARLVRCAARLQLKSWA